MPRLWDDTIEAHRNAVRDATLDATARLVADRGLTSVTMSQIAKDTGIGRATLYKYFPDVDSILVAWHERQVGAHLHQLAEIGGRPGSAIERLEAVLVAFARISHERHSSELEAMLHQGDHVAKAHRHLRMFVRDLIAEGAQQGDVRCDVAPDELASYCLHALSAAGTLASKAAVGRLVAVTLAGLRAGNHG
ncbi:MAG: TetR/AcrR family transcriptional regulator [Candidatus Eremiobacteraeota bacterium]|nr:TetR/AcrR family transcriptional regulator [Candidatus Eremiobacteraeota bacterium]